MASLPTTNSTTSFWHSEPSERLLGHRTTTELPAEADLVIIGSGITGASAARFLTEDARAQGMCVVMLEAREACWGATGRNGGHCQPLFTDRGVDVVRFELRNWQTVQAYVKEHQVPCEWTERKVCRTFWTEPIARDVKLEFDQLRKDAPDLADMMELIDDEDTLRQACRVKGAPFGAISRGCASLWPYKLIAFILERAIDRGLNLQTNTPVTSIETVENRGNTYCQLIQTSRGSIRCRHLVLATNGYTSYLLPEFKDLIVPERGTMSALIPPKGSTRLNYSYGFVGTRGSDPSHHDYLVQRPFEGVPNPRGHLMYGGGQNFEQHESLGTSDDSYLDEGSAAYLRRQLLDMIEFDGETAGLEELEATHQWSGIWGTSRDGMPWVGGVPGRNGVWLAAGYSGHGMPNATLCGKAAVEMVLAEDRGDSPSKIQDQLIEDQELPRCYLITKERIDKASRMESVLKQQLQTYAKYKGQAPRHVMEAMTKQDIVPNGVDR